VPAAVADDQVLARRLRQQSLVPRTDASADPTEALKAEAEHVAVGTGRPVRARSARSDAGDLP
jgi:hypothetical protein